jgi:hypothetical protein
MTRESFESADYEDEVIIIYLLSERVNSFTIAHHRC